MNGDYLYKHPLGTEIFLRNASHGCNVALSDNGNTLHLGRFPMHGGQFSTPTTIQYNRQTTETRVSITANLTIFTFSRNEPSLG